MAYLSNVDSGFPGHRGRVTKSAGTLAEVLQGAGYATMAIGKWHLAPLEETTAAGPYGEWPLGRGFGRYYGFLDALTDHFYPDVVEDNHRVEPPGRPEDGYHLTEDLVDHAISYVRDQVSVKPEQPFFLYVAFGTAHCPHQAPQEYLDKYRGRYDEGWDVIRERRFARQKELGIVPEDATLAPLNPGVEEWDNLSTDQQKLFARFQEAYAAMLDHTDAQMGRLMDYLDSIGRLDNTIVVVLSDNGASQEGGPDGGADIVTYEEDRFCTVEFNMERFDTIGGPHSQTNIPWGWAQAANTPLRWYKQNTYAGGVRTPLIVSWPEGVADAGGVRTRFVHAIDIAPTILDLVDVAPEDSYKGVDQMPYHGASIRDVLDDPAAPAPRDRQYFEMIGHRAMWQDGWKALTRHRRNEPFEEDPWELYHIESDFSECQDVAAEQPEKLADLVGQWSEEASRYSVFPLDDRYLAVRASTFTPPGTPRARDAFTYLGGSIRVPGAATPLVFNRDFSITARVSPLGAADEGVLVAVGDVERRLRPVPGRRAPRVRVLLSGRSTDARLVRPGAVRGDRAVLRLREDRGLPRHRSPGSGRPGSRRHGDGLHGPGDDLMGVPQRGRRHAVPGEQLLRGGVPLHRPPGESRLRPRLSPDRENRLLSGEAASYSDLRGPLRSRSRIVGWRQHLPLRRRGAWRDSGPASGRRCGRLSGCRRPCTRTTRSSPTSRPGCSAGHGPVWLSPTSCPGRDGFSCGRSPGSRCY